mmetsp:Transcript_128477/g.222558  ORF Transcript_128477/g.222558 Transcript_128477/m.222558 type:complete len:275 (+) Transcript_128477:283-1107(+)
MSLRVHLLKLLCINVILDELGKVSLILGWIFFLQHLHVLLHMPTEDALLVRFGVVFGVLPFLLSWLEPWKVLRTVRDMEPAINGTLQGTPHPCANTGPPDADIENCLERSLFSLLILNVVLLSINFFLAFEGLIKAKFLQCAAGNQQARCVRCTIVLVTAGDTKLGKLTGACLCHDDIARNCSIRDLGKDPPVGDAHNQPILLVVELVLVLPHHLATCLEVGLALTATALLHLVPLEEGLVLQHLYKRHAACAPMSFLLQHLLNGESVPKKLLT